VGCCTGQLSTLVAKLCSGNITRPQCRLSSSSPMARGATFGEKFPHVKFVTVFALLIRTHSIFTEHGDAKRRIEEEVYDFKMKILLRTKRDGKVRLKWIARASCCLRRES